MHQLQQLRLQHNRLIAKHEALQEQFEQLAQSPTPDTAGGLMLTNLAQSLSVKVDIQEHLDCILKDRKLVIPAPDASGTSFLPDFVVKNVKILDRQLREPRSKENYENTQTHQFSSLPLIS